MSRRVAVASVALVAAAALAGASPARSHLVTTGLGPFYDGLGHLALTPEDFISVLAAALLVGLRGKAHGRAALLVLPASWLAGGALGLALRPGAEPVVGVLSLLVLGILVAADLTWPTTVTVGLGAAIGLVHGYLNGGALAAVAGGGLGLVGIATSVFVVVALVAAFVTRLEAPWARIAVRVAGSWIAAVGLLMLGWWLQTALA